VPEQEDPLGSTFGDFAANRTTMAASLTIWV
jgi:hypothetical protein